MPINLLRIPDWVIDSFMINGGLLEDEFSSFPFAFKLVIFKVAFLLDQSVMRNCVIEELMYVTGYYSG